MSDETTRKLKALLEAVVKELRLDVVEAPCRRCNNGKWQDGGDCAHCDGATVTYKITPLPCDCLHCATDRLKAGKP
jgi:hypothetical protein